MRRLFQIVLVVILCLGSCTFFLAKPVDIRNDYLKKGLQQEDYEKGKTLIKEMEDAYGGKENWLAHQKGTFVQRADWYGRKKISGWDTIPQRYEMTAYFGSNDCELSLLNGENKGLRWGVTAGNTYTQRRNEAKVFEKNKKHADKLIYKSYWFQFPFRIGEAAIIAYAGTGEVNGETYDLVYATWGSEEPNKEYDQFMLYLNQETRQVEYLHFTVREKFKALSFTARFDNFKAVDDLSLPFSQYVTHGKPQKKGFRMHENHYEEIRLGD